ncbi:MAG: DUF115 domain-containing protein [Agathobacter sp.]|nr:DUF115 domain-containing protein [Agathobacter sp.]
MQEEKMREENLKALEKRFTGIVRLINERKKELLQKENLELEWETSLDGEEILKVQQDGRNLYLAGKRNPAAHAENQVSVLGKIASNAPVLIVGMGNIHYLEEVLKITDKSVDILLYEPVFSIFYKQLEKINVEKIFGDRLIALVVGGINDDGVSALLHTMLKDDRIPLMKQFALPNYEIFAYEKVKKFYEEILAITRPYNTNLWTNMYFNDVLAINIYHNVEYIRTGYTAGQLDGVIPTDIPAIVVSAGPSLNKNIAELKKAKNKAFIIAVDTALKPLIKAGVKPDMYAMLDGKKPLDLINVEETRWIPLVTLATGAKEIMDYHKGKKFFVDEQYEYIYQMFQMNGKTIERLPFGGSVATLAFSLVCHLGFQTVVFVGQDLAYSNDKSHADGTFQEQMEKEDTTEFMMVEGNYEKQVPTIPNLNSYREWFEAFIKSWSQQYTTRFINATEGGAKIEGTELMTLTEVIDQFCARNVDIASCIDRIEPVFSKEEQNRIIDYFHQTPDKIQQIIQLAQEGEKLYKKLDDICQGGKIDKSLYVKVLRRIKKNRKKIEKNFNYQIVAQVMIRADQIIQSSQYLTYSTIEEEGKELARQGKIYMELLQEYAKIVKEIASNTFIKEQ